MLLLLLLTGYDDDGQEKVEEEVSPSRYIFLIGFIWLRENRESSGIGKY